MALKDILERIRTNARAGQRFVPGANLPKPKFVGQIESKLQQSPAAKLIRGEGLKTAFGVEQSALLGRGTGPTKQEVLDIAMGFGPGVIGSITKRAAPKIITTGERYVQELLEKRRIAKEIDKEKGIISKAGDLLKQIKTKLVDFAAPIEDTLASTLKKEKITLLPEAEITPQIDRVLRAPVIAGQFVKNSGLERVIREVDNLDNLEQYLVAKQAKAVRARGIETGRNPTKDDILIEEFAPKYEAQARIVTEYSQKLLDYSTETGLISKELATKLKQIYPDYVPLQRVFSEIERTGKFTGGKAIATLGKQTAVQKLEGSIREIESPIESLLMKTYDVFKQGEKNKAAQILVSYEKLPGNPFKLRRLDIGESAPHTISYFDKGKKVTFETSKEIADAAKALNVQQLSILGKIIALPTRVARLGITGLNIPFIAANIVKDQLTAFINSARGLKTSIVNPNNFFRALFSAVKHDELYDEMVRAGGGGTSFDIAREQIPKTIKKIRSGKSAGRKILYTVTHPSELLRAVEDIVARSEEFTRLQQFRGTKKAALKQGLLEQEANIQAGRAARESTVNFARRGEWGTVLNTTFLYLNAGIQGSRTLLRSFQQRPVATSLKVVTSLFLPTASVTAWNLNDPERKAAYEDIAEYEKENNLIIIPPNPTKDEDGRWNVIKIPLAQGLNSLAGLIRKPMEQAFGLDPVKFNDIATALIGTVSPITIKETEEGKVALGRTALSTLTPQALKPTAEAVTNQSFFTGFPQVPQSLEKLSPELQVKPRTSGTARLIAKPLKVSPIKVENFIKGTFGGVGAQVVNLMDKALAGLDIIPSTQVGGENIAEAISKRFSKARGGMGEKGTQAELKKIIQQQADDSFLRRQEAELLYETLKKLPKEEANEKARTLEQANPLLYEKLKDVAEEDKLGLNYDDRLLKQLQVKNGERAKFIWSKLKEFETKEEKNAYVNDLRSKKIISDEIFEQLAELKRKNY